MTKKYVCGIILTAIGNLGVAQMVARYLGVVEAAGSNPVTQTSASVLNANELRTLAFSLHKVNALYAMLILCRMYCSDKVFYMITKECLFFLRSNWLSLLFLIEKSQYYQTGGKI